MDFVDEKPAVELREMEGQKILAQAREGAKMACSPDSWADNWDQGPYHNHSS